MFEFEFSPPMLTASTGCSHKDYSRCKKPKPSILTIDLTYFINEILDDEAINVYSNVSIDHFLVNSKLKNKCNLQKSDGTFRIIHSSDEKTSEWHEKQNVLTLLISILINCDDEKFNALMESIILLINDLPFVCVLIEYNNCSRNVAVKNNGDCQTRQKANTGKRKFRTKYKTSKQTSSAGSPRTNDAVLTDGCTTVAIVRKYFNKIKVGRDKKFGGFSNNIDIFMMAPLQLLEKNQM